MRQARATVVQLVLEVGRGGLETMSADLAIELARRGVRSIVVGLDGGGQLEERLAAGGVEFTSLGGRRPLDPRYHARLASVLRASRPDAVHSHHFSPLLYAVLARALAGRPRLVHTEHSIEYLLERPDYRRTLRWLARATSSFVVLGERMRRYYLTEIGVSPARLRVIPNGVALLPVQPIETRVETRAALGLGDGFLVVTVGRLAKEKNYALLLGAFDQATRGDAGARLVFIGDGPERDALQARARALGIEGRVHFLGWRTDVGQLLGAFDVFALSSISEGLPMAMLEAMSAGLPVISTRVGDIPEVVADGRTGRLVPEGNEAALTAVLTELRSSPGERQRLGAAARARVAERYSRGAMVDDYLGAYRVTAPAAPPA